MCQMMGVDHISKIIVCEYYKKSLDIKDFGVIVRCSECEKEHYIDRLNGEVNDMLDIVNDMVRVSSNIRNLKAVISSKGENNVF